MIDLLGEAKNHIELYEYALLWKDKTPTLTERSEIKQHWKKHYRLPFPQSKKNPEGLKRVMLLVSGWYLFHADPKLSVEKTQEKLSEWYTVVMTCASMGMAKKDGTILRDRIKINDKQFKGFDDTAQNLDKYLDKINYYRLVCQAKADGPLRTQKIVVPYRIVNLWKQNEFTINERALAILYHYYDDSGKPFDSNKTAISLWITGQTKWVNPTGSTTLATEGYGLGERCCISVSDDLRWKEAQEGEDAEGTVTLRDWPPMKNQLTDQALDNLCDKSVPSHWLEASFGPLQNWDELATAMLKRYGKKGKRVDLSGQYTKTGTKYIEMKCFLLCLLYFVSNKGTPQSEWNSWADVISHLPGETNGYLQVKQIKTGWFYEASEALNWDAVKQWAKNNCSSLKALINDCGMFYSEQGKNRYFGSVEQTNGKDYLVFTVRSQSVQN